MKEIWDAIVIGAGPAGALTAFELAKKHRSVLLLDKMPFPRFKVCGSCLNQEALLCLSRAGLENLPALQDATRIDSLSIYRGALKAEIKLPGGLAVERSLFDRDLAQAAARAGAIFLSETKAIVQSLPNKSQPDFATVEIETNGAHRELQSKAVVVADGLSGTSLRTFEQFDFVVEKSSKLGLGTILNNATENLDRFFGNRIHMFSGARGYLGIVGLSNGRLDLACAIDKDALSAGKSPGQLAFDLIAASGVRPPAGLLEARFHGTDRLSRRRLKVSEERLFVLGDASAYTEPFTGQGIAWALQSALLAANEINAAIAAADWQSLSQAKNNWQNLTDRKLRRRQKMSRLIARSLGTGRIFDVVLNSLVQYPAFGKAVSKMIVSEINGMSRPLAFHNRSTEIASR